MRAYCSPLAWRDVNEIGWCIETIYCRDSVGVLGGNSRESKVRAHIAFSTKSISCLSFDGTVQVSERWYRIYKGREQENITPCHLSCCAVEPHCRPSLASPTESMGKIQSRGWEVEPRSKPTSILVVHGVDFSQLIGIAAENPLHNTSKRRLLLASNLLLRLLLLSLGLLLDLLTFLLAFLLVLLSLTLRLLHVILTLLLVLAQLLLAVLLVGLGLVLSLLGVSGGGLLGLLVLGSEEVGNRLEEVGGEFELSGNEGQDEGLETFAALVVGGGLFVFVWKTMSASIFI